MYIPRTEDFTEFCTKPISGKLIKYLMNAFFNHVASEYIKTPRQDLLWPGEAEDGWTVPVRIKGEGGPPAWKSANPFATPTQDLKNIKLLLHSESIVLGFEFVLVWLVFLFIRKKITFIHLCFNFKNNQSQQKLKLSSGYNK